MPATESTAPGFTLALTAEERAHLLALLEQADHDTRIEAHRTDSLDYKEYVERKESVLRGLIDKLRRA